MGWLFGIGFDYNCSEILLVIIMDRVISKKERLRERRKNILTYSIVLVCITIFIIVVISLMKDDIALDSLEFCTVDNGNVDVSISASGELSPVYEQIMSESFAGVILPYTTADGYNECDAIYQYLGRYSFRILVESVIQADALRREIAELMRQYNSVNTEFEIGPEYTDLVSVVRESNGFKGWSSLYSSTGYKILFAVIFILLLVPALNLSGMISGRMSMRSLIAI